MSKYGMYPAYRINLRSYLPSNSKLIYISNNVARFMELRCNKALWDHIGEDNREVIIVFVCGHGDEQGFYCSLCTKSFSDPERIKADWWDMNRIGRKVRIYLFAFVCNSYEYLNGSNMHEYVRGAIGFDNKIMISLEAKDAKFWIHFFRKLYSTLSARPKIDDMSYRAVRALYQKYYGKNHMGFWSWIGSLFNRQPSYLGRLCLMAQSDSMKVAIRD